MPVHRRPPHRGAAVSDTDQIIQAAADTVAMAMRHGLVQSTSIGAAVAAAITPLIRAQIAKEIEDCDRPKPEAEPLELRPQRGMGHRIRVAATTADASRREVSHLWGSRGLPLHRGH